MVTRLMSSGERAAWNYALATGPAGRSVAAGVAERQSLRAERRGRHEEASDLATVAELFDHAASVLR